MSGKHPSALNAYFAFPSPPSAPRFCLWLRYRYVELRHLLRRYLARSAGHRVRGALGLGEGHRLSDIVLLGKERHRAVDPRGEAAVGRRTVLERLQHMPEPALRLLRPDSKYAEHLLLHLPPVYTNAAAAQFPAAADQVIGAAMYRAGIALQKVHLLRPRLGERVRHGVPALILVVPLEQGQVVDQHELA